MTEKIERIRLMRHQNVPSVGSVDLQLLAEILQDFEDRLDAIENPD